MTYKKIIRQNSIYGVGLIVMWLWLASPVSAILINPSSAPPGGLTSQPLKVIDSPQSKLGSLLVGTSNATCETDNPDSACARLCLNAVSTVDTERCITSWSPGLSTAISNSLVRVWKDVRPDEAKYTERLQGGYVHIQGLDVLAYPTTTTFSVPNLATLQSHAALVADGIDTNNYAGVFQGDVGIEPTAAPFLSSGLLCLNSTCNLNSNAPECKDPGGFIAQGKYCISKWSDLALTVSDKLTRQSLGPIPFTEQGNVALTQSFNSGSIIVGDPEVMNVSVTCGDGMCSSQEYSGGSCLIDCEIIPVPTSFTTTSTSNSVTLTIKKISTNADVLVVRSNIPDQPFQPQNGVTYQTTLGPPSLTIIYTGSCGTTCTITDTGLTNNTKYYYRAWLSNAYPRYSEFVTKREAKTTP